MRQKRDSNFWGSRSKVVVSSHRKRKKQTPPRKLVSFVQRKNNRKKKKSPLTCDEFPAVVVPSFLKTVRSWDSDCGVTPGRMPSSSETTMGFSSSVLGSMIFVLTGTISSRKRPEACAAAARACERAASLSWTSLPTP